MEDKRHIQPLVTNIYAGDGRAVESLLLLILIRVNATGWRSFIPRREFTELDSVFVDSIRVTYVDRSGNRLVWITALDRADHVTAAAQLDMNGFFLRKCISSYSVTLFRTRLKLFESWRRSIPWR